MISAMRNKARLSCVGLLGALGLSVAVAGCSSEKSTSRGPADRGGTSVARSKRDLMRADIMRPPALPRPSAEASGEAADAGGDARRAAAGFVAGSPAAVLKGMYDAIRRNDGTSLRPFFSKESAELVEKLAKRLGGAGGDRAEDPWRDIRRDMSKDKTLEEIVNKRFIVREDVTGDKAKVWVREGGQGAETALSFVKEEGEWRLDFAEDIKGELRDLPKRLGKADDIVRQIKPDTEKVEDLLRRAEREARGSGASAGRREE